MIELELTDLVPGMYHWDDVINENNKKIRSAMDQVNITTFHHISQLGLEEEDISTDDFSTNLGIIAEKMPKNSILQINMGNTSNSKFNNSMHKYMMDALGSDMLPTSDAFFSIEKCASHRVPCIVKVSHNESDEILLFTFDANGDNYVVKSPILLGREHETIRPNLITDGDFVLDPITTTFTTNKETEMVYYLTLWRLIADVAVDGSIDPDTDYFKKFKLTTHEDSNEIVLMNTNECRLDKEEYITASTRVKVTKPCQLSLTVTDEIKDNGKYIKTKTVDFDETMVNKWVTVYTTVKLTRCISAISAIIKINNLNDASFEMTHCKVENSKHVTKLSHPQTDDELFKFSRYFAKGIFPQVPGVLDIDENTVQIATYINTYKPLYKTAKLKVTNNVYLHNINREITTLFLSEGDVVELQNLNNVYSFAQPINFIEEGHQKGDLYVLNGHQFINNFQSYNACYEIDSRFY